VEVSVVPAASPGGTVRLSLDAGARATAEEVAGCPLLVVDRGIVAVVAGESRRAIVIAVASAGQVLAPPVPGELLVALAPAVISAISPERYRGLLARPEGARAVVNALRDALADRHQSLAVFGHVSHVDRVRAKLLQLARRHGRVTPDGIAIDLPLTHDLLGRMVGSARETVTVAVRDLTTEGFLSRQAGRFVLAVPPDAL
jgi:CRP-like cAMP-binding protein